MDGPHMTPTAPPHVLPGAWYFVALLCALYTVSFVDRFVLVVIAAPLSAAYHLSDTDMSLLMGVGFAIVYSLASLPLATLIDNRQRRLILAAGTALWSLSTVASGFATSYTMLLVLRSGIAIGEAVLTPAAVSLIADLFPPHRRTAPMSTYSAVGAVSGMGAIVLVALALQLATRLEPISGLEPWRMTFILVGLPGILIALLLMLYTKEPPRTQQVTSEKADIGAFLRYLLDNRVFYLPFYLAVAAFSLSSMAVIAWMPSHLVRAFGMSVMSAGYAYGLVAVAATALGTIFWPNVGRWLERRYPQRGFVMATAIGTGIAVPFMVLAPLGHSPNMVLIGMAGTVFSLSAYAVNSGLVVQQFGPPRMRARLMAIYIMSLNVIGLALGPLLVARLATHWPGDSSALGYGLATLAAVCAPLGFLCNLLVLRFVGTVSAADGQTTRVPV